jgi:hypothetical protein
MSAKMNSKKGREEEEEEEGGAGVQGPRHDGGAWGRCRKSTLGVLQKENALLIPMAWSPVGFSAGDSGYFRNV